MDKAETDTLSKYRIPEAKKINGITVTDIKMPFLSMVEFMVKWAIASIPAFIILTVIGTAVFGFLSGLMMGLR